MTTAAAHEGDLREARHIHVCIRKTLDWSDEALVNARIIPGFRRTFDVWNATLTMPYHVFRQRLKAIAELSFSRISGAVCSSLDDVPRGHIVVPVDDDDWLAPDLVRQIRQAQPPDSSLFLWRRDMLEYEPLLMALRRRVSPLIGFPDRFTCKTNSYAVRNEPEFAPLALNHGVASVYFDRHLADVSRIPAMLGIQNRNLASQTTLVRRGLAIRPQDLVFLLKKYRVVYTAWKPTGESEWVTPYVALMAELMTEVDAR